MVLAEIDHQPPVCYEFTANLLLLCHSTKYICEGFQATGEYFFSFQLSVLIFSEIIYELFQCLSEVSVQLPLLLTSTMQTASVQENGL